MTVDRNVLRMRLIDILSLFAPRRGWEVDHRVPYWLDRLMEADRPDGGSERSVAVFEVERLRRRVAELEVAYDLQREAAGEVEGERAELYRKVEAVRTLLKQSARDVVKYGLPRERDYEDLVDMLSADDVREALGDAPLYDGS